MKKNYSSFVFKKNNFYIMLIGLFFLILGFILMLGGGSDDPNVFNPAIFNFQRIILAPTLILIGFTIQIIAILYKKKKN